MGTITFILGGVRSGKSSYALSEANLLGGKKAFIATAEGLDEDMRKRISRHQEERGPSWETFEEPVNITGVLATISTEYPVILIDCLTLWVSNLLHLEMNAEKEFEGLVSRLLQCRDSHVYVVSNEVGMGIVPEYPLGRVYRDQLGLLNKMIARIATTATLMVAGIPLKIKGER